MSYFTTRVELHYGTEEDYTKLHKEMGKEGFRQTISGSDGVEYQLPPAEYNLIGDFTGEQVRSKARDAANRTGKSNGVLVTEGSRYWIGLREATAKSAARV